MKKSEIAALLTVAAALERSGWVPDQADVDVWHAMAEQDQWPSYDAAYRALLVYRSEHPDYAIRPGHITGVLAQVRRASSIEFNAYPPEIPDSVARSEDPQAFSRWLRHEADAHRARHLAAFAAGHQPTLRAIEATP